MRFDALLDKGFELVPSCLENVLQGLSENPCAEDWRELLQSCHVLEGRGERGESCHYPELRMGWLGLPIVRTCEEGLTCGPVDGRCGPPSAEPHERPWSREGDSCRGWCAPEDTLYCADGSCKRRESLGESCSFGGCEGFVAPPHCGGAGRSRRGVCENPPEFGEACDPRKWLACGVERSGWCQPETGVCGDQELPRICNAAYFD